MIWTMTSTAQLRGLGHMNIIRSREIMRNLIQHYRPEVFPDDPICYSLHSKRWKADNENCPAGMPDMSKPHSFQSAQ